MTDSTSASFVDSSGEYRILGSENEHAKKNDRDASGSKTQKQKQKQQQDQDRPHTRAQQLTNRYQPQLGDPAQFQSSSSTLGTGTATPAGRGLSNGEDPGASLEVLDGPGSSGDRSVSSFANFISLGGSGYSMSKGYHKEAKHSEAENRVPLMGSESRVSGLTEAMGSFLQMCKEMVESVIGSCFGKHFVIHGKRFQMIRVLGEGGFSFVYLVKSRSSGDLYAIKRIYAQNTEQKLNVRWEIQVHDTFSHKNLLKLVDSAMIDGGNGRLEALLLFPAYTRGSLVDILQKTTFSPSKILSIFVGICKGVLEMHKHNPPWAHRDIKPANVLLSSDDTPVLMDFGSTCVARVEVKSRSIGLELQEQAAKNSSMPYRACELWDPKTGSIIDERTDVWSLGCLLFAMVYGKGYSPFECQFNSNSDVPTVRFEYNVCLAERLSS